MMIKIQLYSCVSVRGVIKSLRAGRPTTLTIKQELEIIRCLLAGARFGYPCERQELLHLVGS